MTNETFYTTFNTAIHWCNNSYILCNNIAEIDESIWDNCNFDLYDEEDDPVEIFQYFITDCSGSDVKWLTKTFDGLLFTYSEKLDCYILCVDHYGTSWDYVPVEVLSEDWKRINADKEYKD